MGEERIKSEEELNGEQKPLSTEELEEVSGGTGFHQEETAKSNNG
jgi:bacteriocin-like protein